VDVAVGFFADLFDGARYRNARVQDLEPTGIVDVLPECLIAVCISYLRRFPIAGDLRRVQRLINEKGNGPNN